MHSSSSGYRNANAGSHIDMEIRPPVTRSRAKAFGTSAGIPPSSKPSFKQDQKRVLRANHKRGASDENKVSVTGPRELRRKRRAVLRDVTNLGDGIGCKNAPKIQAGKQGAKAVKNGKDTDVAINTLIDEDALKTQLAEDLSKIRVAEPVETASLNSKDREEERKILEKLETTTGGQEVVDIDSNLRDPQLCGLYAPDIYNFIRVAELQQRASTDYMERVQRDITPNMRGILIDWLVEVSEEYKLVSDTLYLTVNLIDRFLSENYIEKHRLQLLGVTCMLLASKYEEICAPRVEEFCFITDNTYSKGEVLKMETQVLNFLHFQLSVPSTKTFLRRFIQAAQGSSEVPSVELEFLANYLAELTLVEYNFLKFLPSLIAASAVFLARWTLDQSNHPWNPTLQHYTRYGAPDLKNTVIAMEDLHLNTSGCILNAIREKYKQEKFKSVATLASPVRVVSLFLR